MTNSSVLPKSPQRFSAAVSRGLREGSAISLGALVLVLVVALISFDARDPGFSYTGSGEAIHNRIGSVGAYFAEVAINMAFHHLLFQMYELYLKRGGSPIRRVGESDLGEVEAA